jgi:uncharacterized membrane protein
MQSDPKFKERQAAGARLAGVDRIAQWIGRSYLSVILAFLFLYVSLPFAAPMLMKAGYEGLARPIYTIYGAVCHQLPFRSWFLFGEQFYYPRASAGIEGVQTFQEATGIDETAGDSRLLLQMRDFVGNETMGYKVAYCQRDIAIYGSMLLFGLAYLAAGRRWRSLHWGWWLLIGIAPIALDGFSQLLSQPPFGLWVYRESTPLLRTITGALFGLTTAWFGFPLLEEPTTQAQVAIASKKARLANKSKD